MKRVVGLSLMLSACVVNAPTPQSQPAQDPAPPPAAAEAAPSAAPAPAPAPTDSKPGAVQDTDDPPDAPKEAKASLADGRPKGFKPGAPDSVWIWQDAKGTHWHLRTSTKDKGHRFHGFIRGDADVKNVKSVRTESGDRWKMKGKGASFDFNTTAAADGL